MTEGNLFSREWKHNPEELSNFISDQGLQWLHDVGGLSELVKALDTDLQNGLNSSSTGERKQYYGENRFPEKPPEPFLKLCWDALQDRTLQILIVCAIGSIILEMAFPKTPEERKTGWIEGTAILIAVTLVVMVTSVNDYNKEKQFRKLNAAADDKKIKVRRDGTEQLVSIFDVVVGDIALLESGDTIPADGIFINGFDLKADEAAMTGESDPVKKNSEKIFMLSNCKILEGTGSMLVLAVGVNSQWGKIRATLDSERDDTPLQVKLDTLAEDIGKMGLAAAVLTFLALVIRRIVQLSIPSATEHWSWSEINYFINALIISITIVVVAIPEGLPLAVTISLAYSMMKMMKDNNLVRHLAACETMGGATNICSDKTGTLTENKMTLTDGYLAMNTVTQEKADLNPTMKSLVIQTISTNSTAYIVEKNGAKEPVGSKTEVALLEFVDKRLGESWETIRKRYPPLKVFPFSSKTKQMSSAILLENGNFRLHQKGAPEIVLAHCDFVLDQTGTPVPFTDQLRTQVHNIVENMASRGLRTLCFAFNDYSGSPELMTQAPEEGLICIGVVGIKDPVRKEVPQAVQECQAAGITVRMVTGDNILTAQHIARECGILTDNGICVEGPKFRKMSTQEMDNIIPRLQVMARSSPDDKLTLVKRLKALGEVVASTGDGTNDAPQLKEADVGFAMGIAGTEVAKEASDIILLDDNFASVVKAVMWGRNVYDSIRKFLQFQLTVNICAVVVAFIGAVTSGESPLSAVQMLWVNLIMDTFAALALATEQPTRALLERPPYGRFDSLITNTMWRMILGQAAFQLAVLFTLLYAYDKLIWLFGENPHDVDHETHINVVHTIIFNTFVLAQVFNEINCRKLGNDFNIFAGFFSNFIFIGVILFTIIVQFIIVQFGGLAIPAVPLTFRQWVVCIGIGAFSIPWGFVLRLIPVPEDIPAPRVSSEEDPLLLNQHRDLIPIGNRWNVARRVLKEVKVINALRRFHR